MQKQSGYKSEQKIETLVSSAIHYAQKWLPKGLAAIEQHGIRGIDKAQKFRQQRREQIKRKPVRARLIWVLPIPVLLASFIDLITAQFGSFLVNTVASAMFLFAAIVSRKGFLQEVAEQHESFSKLKTLPFKTLGATLLGLATLWTAWLSVGHEPGMSILYGVGAFSAFALLYGLDLRLNKKHSLDAFNGDNKEVKEALQKAHAKLLEIEQAMHVIQHPELKQRLQKIVALGQKILNEIANNPAYADSMRKFLNVYLDGAKSVVISYTKSHPEYTEHPLEANFRRILITIEDTFTKQYQKILEKDWHALDIQIEVLRTRLKHEGLV